MSQYNKIVPIDIPAGRKLILKSISEYDRQHALAEAVEAFFRANVGKKIDKRMADKLHLELLKIDSLLVGRVGYEKKPGFPPLTGEEYQFKVYWHGMHDTNFTVRHTAEGAIDFDWLMMGHRYFQMEAQMLRDKIDVFAYRAGKFNEALAKLREASSFADAPPPLGNIYPLSDMFHWYALKA